MRQSAVGGHARAGEPGATFRERWFAGFTVKGGAILLAVCAINALRRVIGNPDLWNEPFAGSLQVASTLFSGLLVAVPVVVAVVVAYNRLPFRGWRLHAGLALVAAVASATGAILMVGWETDGAFGYQDDLLPILRDWRSILVHWPRYLVWALLFAGVYAYLRRRHEQAAAMRQAEADDSALAHRLTEATLQMLQAQIEPHFLFNTLANVKRLYQTAPAAGGDMLDNLMRYLEVVLPHMRDSASTLAREVALAQAYLGIHKIRMGARLAVEIDVPGPLLAARVPPMLIAPLVENAIKHGLNPLPGGGSVRIAAAQEQGRLVVRVSDTGAGFTSSSGSGIGLANLRARLGVLYGVEGRLSIAAGMPRGVVATVELPRRDVDANGAPG